VINKISVTSVAIGWAQRGQPQPVHESHR